MVVAPESLPIWKAAVTIKIQDAGNCSAFWNPASYVNLHRVQCTSDWASFAVERVLCDSIPSLSRDPIE